MKTKSEAVLPPPAIKPPSRASLRKAAVEARKGERLALQIKHDERMANMTVDVGDVFAAADHGRSAIRRVGNMRRVIGFVGDVVVYSIGGDRVLADKLLDFKGLCGQKIHQGEAT